VLIKFSDTDASAYQVFAQPYTANSKAIGSGVVDNTTTPNKITAAGVTFELSGLDPTQVHAGAAFLGGIERPVTGDFRGNVVTVLVFHFELGATGKRELVRLAIRELLGVVDARGHQARRNRDLLIIHQRRRNGRGRRCRTRRDVGGLGATAVGRPLQNGFAGVASTNWTRSIRRWKRVSRWRCEQVALPVMRIVNPSQSRWGLLRSRYWACLTARMRPGTICLYGWPSANCLV
jgi:hypothetical protein